jgi:hypothetical protein
MKALLFFAFLAAVPCFSQTTWGGLRFGMTPEQAREVLKDRSINDRLEPARRVGNTEVPEVFFIDVQGVTVGAAKEGVAHVRFDKNKTLESVTIRFERGFADSGCFQGISTEESGTRLAMVDDISEKMLERFGKPVNETGTFPTMQNLAKWFVYGRERGNGASIEGKRIWRTEGQVIGEEQKLVCGGLLIYTTYQLQTKEL